MTDCAGDIHSAYHGIVVKPFPCLIGQQDGGQNAAASRRRRGDDALHACVAFAHFQCLRDDLTDIVAADGLSPVSYTHLVDFAIKDTDEKLRVYTTRPDTLFGATYMVVAPEHATVDKLKDRITNWDDVVAYREAAARKSDFERTELSKEKTGVELKGIKAIDPVDGREIPVFISDYVLATYGTGAIMAVPAHDTRDWEFATKFGLPIVEVVAGGEDVQKAAYTDVEDGVLCNSGFLNGLTVAQAKKTIIDWLVEHLSLIHI